MKKIFLLIMLCALIAATSGCGTNGGDSSSSAEESNDKGYVIIDGKAYSTSGATVVEPDMLP
ncbi:MAG: hypothetical protein LIO53_04735 [Oscillospiraceae bacterium]|nr:hypothetical protein [Oscillospiraceae bacterium]